MKAIAPGLDAAVLEALGLHGDDRIKAVTIRFEAGSIGSVMVERHYTTGDSAALENLFQTYRVVPL